MTSGKMVRSITMRVAIGLVAMSMASPIWSQSWQTCGSNLCSSAGASVGVGTTSPIGPLDVAADGPVSTNYSAYNQLFVTGKTNTNQRLALGYDTANNLGLIQAYVNGGSVVPLILQSAGGNVGIGTTTPSSLLDIYGNSTAKNITLGVWSASSTYNALYLNGLTSTLGAYNLLSSNADQNLFVNRPYGKDIRFRENNADQVTILAGGNVGVGTTTPQYKLAVNGTIGTKEVVVTNTGWADYVFTPGYRLRPLHEVAAYIEENHHLPDIPSEAEVQDKGVSLGELQVKLLAKIEELTLHMIQQDEENRQLRERIANLEAGHSVKPQTRKKDVSWTPHFLASTTHLIFGPMPSGLLGEE